MTDIGTGSPRVAILVIGSEITSGEIADRNSKTIARRLTQLGVTDIRFGAVGDDPVQISWHLGAFREAGVDIVFVTGGRGSTKDDLTNATEAQFTGRTLVTDDNLSDRIFAMTWTHFERSMEAPSVATLWDQVLGALSPGMTAEEALRHSAIRQALLDAAVKQATVPEGAVVLSPVGTAPAYLLEVPGHPIIVALPGPPLEAEVLLDHVLQLEEFQLFLGDVTPRTQRIIRLVGVAEEMLAMVEREAERRGLLSGLPSLSTCYTAGGAELEITVTCTEAEMAAWERLVAFVESVFGEAMFSVGPSVDAMVATLRGSATIAVVDCATPGAVSQRLDQRQQLGDAGRPSGLVVRDPDDLASIMGVPAASLSDGVSPEAVYEAAQRAQVVFGADIGVAVAGTDVVHVAVATKALSLSRTFGPPPSPYDRESFYAYVGTVVLHHVREVLQRVEMQ
jgi:nicotinamide-nucleotide amidase